MKHRGRIQSDKEKQKRIDQIIKDRRNSRQPLKLPNPAPRRVVSRIHRSGTVIKPRPLLVRPFPPLTATFKHSGDLGDLWYSLPAIRYLGGGTLYLNADGLKTRKPDGTISGLNSELIKMSIPLLESQHYIKKVDKWNQHQKVSLDIDIFRKVFPPKPSLCEKILASFSVPFSEIQKPWIECEPKKIARVVFNRSFRYRNENTKYKEVLEENSDSAIFIGLPEEHQDFENKFGKIDYYKIKDFLEMAQVINGSELFVGNQSSPLALAIAMHKPYLQESYVHGADCRIEIPHAKYM